MQTKEEISAQKKEYYLANKERIAKTQGKYYKLNKKKVAITTKLYRELNKEKVTAARKSWRNSNKEKSCANDAKRRALKINAEAKMSDAEKKNYANLVVIRDKATALFGYEWHIDHTIPLSLGGTNAIDNLEVVPASWNVRKNNTNSNSYWG